MSSVAAATALGTRQSSRFLCDTGLRQSKLAAVDVGIINPDDVFQLSGGTAVQKD
jgi:hypothetical protein